MSYDQLIEVISFFGLQKLISFFSRCTACNIKLAAVAKKDVLHVLEPKTKRYFDKFFQCPKCKMFFGKGHIMIISKTNCPIIGRYERREMIPSVSYCTRR